MIIGRQQGLTAKRMTENGCYLVDQQDREVLLPKSYVPEDLAPGDCIEVFVYRDSEDRLVAVTTKPLAQLEEFAYLQVVDVNRIGAFMDWGLPKDLLVPFSEQAQTMQVGKWYLVFVCYDEETDRLIGSAKVKQFIYFDDIDLALADEVDILPYKKNDLGVEAIVNNMYRGLVFESDIHQPLKLGLRIKAYVKNIREDGKIDLSLAPIGYKKSTDRNTELILKKLRVQNGYLPLHDKSTPEEINAVLGISKKAFKRTIGNMYKQKLIMITADGIRQL